MPRSLWKGAVSFGLVTIPVKLYGATETKDISFNQVHASDGGRVRYKRVCEECGQEVPFEDIAKGYTASDGRTAVLDKADLDSLPLATGKGVEIVQFVDEADIDPSYFEKTYFMEADGPGAKPYVLLRDALARTGKSAVVKVALRSRESLALIRPKDQLLLLHTMLWPDELRDGEFAEPGGEVAVSDAEIGMAENFIEQLTADFDPDRFSDTYREALDELVTAKLSGAAVAEEKGEAPKKADVVDLVAALRASVEAAKKRRGEDTSGGGEPDPSDAEPRKPRKATARKTAKKAS